MNELRADPVTGLVSQVLSNGALKPLYASVAAASLAANPLQTADIAATVAEVPLVIDTPCALSASYAITASSVFYRPQGKITLGAFNLVHPPEIYADPYSFIFNQTATAGEGQVYFTGQTVVSPCWWGADSTGNTNPTAELNSRNAFQMAEIAVDTNGSGMQVTGSVVSPPPGTYVLDAGLSVFFRNSHHIAKPGSVRIDFDPATVVANAGNIGLFASGTPGLSGASQRIGTGQKLAGWTAGTNAPATNCNFIGAISPASTINGNKWIGIDIAHNITGQGFLGNNKFLIGLYLTAAFNQYIADSNFIGLPCDGVNISWGSGTMSNVEGSLNGFYGGSAFNNTTTRNGATFSGWFDVRTPYLTTDSIRVIDCRFKANAGSGLAPGGCSNDTLVDGCTTVGNGDISYEFILFEGEDCTQYQNSVTLAQFDIMYVPSSSGEPPNLGGLVWQCTNGGGGTTASTGSGPTGTLGSVVVDGTVTFTCIGSMPANGRIPATYSIANTTDDGAVPASVNVPWFGGVTVPANQYGTANTLIHVAVNAGNEKRISIKNVLARCFGSAESTSSVCEINSNNGGTVEIDGYELDNCYQASAANAGMVGINIGAQSYWNTPFHGTKANNKTSIRIRNLRFKSPTLTNSAFGALHISGNQNAYDIEGVNCGAITSGYAIYIEHSDSAASVLDYGRIANCRTGATPGAAIVLSWSHGGSVTSGIDIDGNRLFGSGAAYTFVSSGPALAIQSSSAATIPATIRLAGNVFSYGGPTTYPISTSNINAGSMLLEAFNNSLNEGQYGLFGTVTTPLTNSSAFYQIQAANNGLPGDGVTYGTGAPSAGTYQVGDINRRLNAGAGGVAYDQCITAGTLSGQMSDCSVSLTAPSYTGTYSGTPPLPGEWVTFASGPTGAFKVCFANGGTIGFASEVTTSASSISLNYSAAAFKTVSLSS